jgi:predicted anti-sigma-YlaC factor YlaD
MKLMLSCREASRLISEKLDRDLGIAERAALRVHLAICEACTRMTRQFDFLRRAARQYPGPDDGPQK